jgi:hypothetical protein
VAASTKELVAMGEDAFPAGAAVAQVCEEHRRAGAGHPGDELAV